MCLYVALANVALGLRALQLLVPKVLIMNFVCRLLQVLHVCPACVCVYIADLSVIPPNTVFQLIPHSGKLSWEITFLDCLLVPPKDATPPNFMGKTLP